jgi:hypothetical protein
MKCCCVLQLSCVGCKLYPSAYIVCYNVSNFGVKFSASSQGEVQSSHSPKQLIIFFLSSKAFPLKNWLSFSYPKHDLLLWKQKMMLLLPSCKPARVSSVTSLTCNLMFGITGFFGLGSTSAI